MNFVPGTHLQFSLQYLELIPLLLAMTGLEPLLLFGVFNKWFPGTLDVT